MTAIDALAFLGPSLYGPGQDVSDIHETMGAAGVAVTVLAPARPPDYSLPPANENVARAQSRDDAFVGLARVDPNRADAPRHLTRCLDGLGLRGLFLHPFEETFQITDPRVQPLIEICADQRRPVVIASGYPWLSEALQVAELAARYPDVPFVMTNGGQFNISGLGQTDAEIALDTCPNISIHTTGVYRQDFIERVVATHGADRVMFAGGSPHFEPAYEILRIRHACLDEPAREMLLAGTARRVFAL